VNGLLPASMATLEEFALNQALREDQLENPDSWRRIADYLKKERVEAVNALENGEPSDPNWWADRVE
jgi:hypothetical protein